MQPNRWAMNDSVGMMCHTNYVETFINCVKICTVFIISIFSSSENLTAQRIMKFSQLIMVTFDCICHASRNDGRMTGIVTCFTSIHGWIKHKCCIWQTTLILYFFSNSLIKKAYLLDHEWEYRSQTHTIIHRECFFLVSTSHGIYVEIQLLN